MFFFDKLYFLLFLHCTNCTEMHLFIKICTKKQKKRPVPPMGTKPLFKSTKSSSIIFISCLDASVITVISCLDASVITVYTVCFSVGKYDIVLLWISSRLCIRDIATQGIKQLSGLLGSKGS